MSRRFREPATFPSHCTPRCLGPWLVLLAALLGVGAPARAADAHPKDGPDIDLRLTIADSVVRLHLTMNLAFVDEFVDVPREDPTALHPVEHAGLAAALLERLDDVARVDIDGATAAPQVGPFHVSDEALQLLPLFPTYGSRALIQVTQTLEYPTASPARSVELHWSEYPPDVTLALATGVPLDEADPIMIDGRLLVGARDDPLPLRAHQPSFRWTRDGSALAPARLDVPAPVRERPGAVPVPAALCLLGAVAVLALRRPRELRVRALLAGLAAAAAVGLWPMEAGRMSLGTDHDPGLPDAEAARAIFEPLHANIYSAFDHATPEDVYDALAASVGGELLPSVYDRIYRGLVMQDHGGAVARVQAVRPLETELLGSARDDKGAATFEIRARWQVDGIVRHWGHSHERTHEYAARYLVRAEDDGWRLVRDEVLEERQLSATPLTPGLAEPAWQPGEEL